MGSLDRTLRNWSTAYAKPAKLNQNQKIAVNLLAILFLVMAAMQLVNFSDFKAALAGLSLNNGTTFWAVAVVVAEVWAAISFVAISMIGLFRVAGRVAAVFASGFWLLVTFQAVSGFDTGLGSNAFFGKYLTQMPGWWTVIEATVFMGWTLYALEVTKKH